MHTLTHTHTHKPLVSTWTRAWSSLFKRSNKQSMNSWASCWKWLLKNEVFYFNSIAVQSRYRRPILHSTYLNSIRGHLLLKIKSKLRHAVCGHTVIIMFLTDLNSNIGTTFQISLNRACGHTGTPSLAVKASVVLRSSSITNTLCRSSGIVLEPNPRSSKWHGKKKKNW